MDTFIYNTIAGDTFDSIALDFFDDEKYSPEIINLNLIHADILRFSAGVPLTIPISVESQSESLPPWK